MQAINQIKRKNEVTLDFNPHPGQQDIAEALLDYKYVVVRAGRRFGKSSLALNLVFREALHNPGRYWIIAPEYKQAKSIYWRDLVDEFIPKDLILKKNDSELILEIKSFVDGKKSVIEFKGSDNENTLRGAGLKGVVLDEYAFQKESVWDKIIGPMLVQTNGWALFITTPNGVANHFKKFWDSALEQESVQSAENAHDTYVEQLEEANKRDGTERQPTKEGFFDWQHRWKTFHFSSYDYRGPDWETMHENLDVERKRLTEEFFTQEYLAEFAKFAGLIYTAFDDKKHVQDFEVDENWSFYRSIDFGATDPTAVSFIGVDKDGVNYIFDEIYMSDIRTSELAELIKQKSAHRYYIATYADSAGKQSILDLGEYGINAIPVQKNKAAKETGSRQWIISGIDRVQQILKDDKIIIHPRCKATIKEFMSYSWRKDRLGDPVNMPEDKNNHIMDEVRYYIMMYNSHQEEEVFNYLGKPADSIVGY